MTHLDLFSGIGGFALGLRMAGGFQTVAFCEIETFCHRILNRHWPDAPIIEDVHDVTAELIRERTGHDRIDIITAGVPCQPASVAGKQLGSADDRWLWPETIRIIADIKPRWVVLENPDGIYSVGLAGILSELESLGYANSERPDGSPVISPIEIPACGIGAPIIRNRVFIVASANNTEWRADRHIRRDSEQRQNSGRKKENSEFRAYRESVNRELAEPKSITGRQSAAGSCTVGDSKRRLQEPVSVRDNEHWSGAEYIRCEFDGKYRRVPAIESGLFGVADGVSAGVAGPRIEPPLTIHVKPRSRHSKAAMAKLKAVGNSVNPQTVAEIGKAILAAESLLAMEAAA